MKDSSKKVVILENLASPYVHQAILVMRDYNPKLESHAIIEAERIVNAYLENLKLKGGRYRPSARKKPSLFWYFVTAVISAAVMFFITRL